MSGTLRIPALGILAFLIIVFAAAPADAAVYYVLNSGSNSNDGLSWGAAFQTIQYGLNNASNGDTIIVGNGTFSGAGNINLVFSGKQIHLRTANGAGFTTINGSGVNRAFNLNNTFETNLTIIEGFTITNCYNNTGGAIYISNSSPVIKYCIFQSNTANSQGGAIFVRVAQTR